MQFITDNLMLVTVAVVSGLMLVYSFIGNKVRGVKEVDSNGALQMINHKNALVLDVREQDEFKGGHILNAKLIPLGDLKSQTGQIERHREGPIVVVCRSGKRSGVGSAILAKAGFKEVYSLAGGMMAWQRANLPVEK